MTNRLTKEQIHELRTADSATVANAIEKFHVRDPIEGYMGWTSGVNFRSSA